MESKFQVPVYEDTEEMVTEEIERLFKGDEKALEAFEKLVEGLRVLIVKDVEDGSSV